MWEETINVIFSSDLDLTDIDVANKIEEERGGPRKSDRVLSYEI